MTCWSRKIFNRKNALITAAVTLIILAGSTFPLFAADPLFANLEKRLIKDGLDAEFVGDIYRHSSVKLEPNIISVNLQWKESTVNYNQFLDKKTVAKAKAYLHKHREALDAADKRFGVSPAIIVAILTVETRLGTFTGNYHTINVLSTMAVADNLPVQKKIFASLLPENTDADSLKQLMKRLNKRVDRGYRDLKALLLYVQENGNDPFAIKGSREGAIGIPQFLPSNISQYGHDGNNDGMVDLFNHEDAIATVASFLKMHHWNETGTEEEKGGILFRYNRSSSYVDAIYALCSRLKKNNS